MTRIERKNEIDATEKVPVPHFLLSNLIHLGTNGERIYKH